LPLVEPLLSVEWSLFPDEHAAINRAENAITIDIFFIPLTINYVTKIFIKK
jgi:hypothetical protein